MSRFKLPDRKVILTRHADGSFDTTTRFGDEREVDNICLHHFSPCECDYRTTQRLIDEFMEDFPDYEKYL